MNFDTNTAADYAAAKLDLLLERATRDSAEALATNNIPIAVTHFARLREKVDALADKMAELQKHIKTLSYELLPTMFDNQNVPKIKVDDVGTVSIVDNWSASIIDGQRDRAFDWLRSTGNSGLIQETVNAQTLKAFAKTEAQAQRPLPADIFAAKPAPYVSIRKS